jgi:tetratricopeptide (TPR) repeat protein
MKKFLGTMMICTIMLSSTAVLVIGCGSEPAAHTVDSEIEEGIREKAQAFGEAQGLISVGTPSSIDRALEIIASADLGTTDRGAELLYIARNIYRVVYPYLSFPAEEVPQLAETSLYRRLFAAVEEGDIPPVPEGEATFLTTLVSTLAMLTSEEREVIDEAAARSSQLLSINPDSSIAVFLRGYALEQRGEPEEAIDRYREVIGEDESCYPARMGIVRVLNEMNRGEEAVETVEELLERFGEERRIVRLAVEVFLQAGDLSRADDLLSEALGRYPEDSVLLRKRALLLERTGRGEQAQRIIRVVESREGVTAESLLIRIRILEQQGRSGEALLESREGIERFPDAPRLRLARARLLLERERPAEAQELLEGLDERLPNNREIGRLRLRALMGQERWDEAREQLELLLRRDQPSADLLTRGIQVYNALGESEQALEIAEQLAGQYPDQPNAVERYVRQLARMGRSEEARRYLAERLQETAQSTLASELHYLLSEVQNGREAQIRSLQTALFENMQNERALIKISRLYEEAGEYSKAVRYLRQAVSLNPRNEELKRRLRSLEQETR